MENQTYSEETLVAAHEHTAHNEEGLRRSERCVCMCCGNIVTPVQLDRPDVAPDADEQYWPDGNWVAGADPGGRSAEVDPFVLNSRPTRAFRNEVRLSR